MQARHLLSVAIAVLGASSSASCFDPVHSDAVDALGPERRGVRPGPNHRPGQNCLTCHGGQGPGSPELSIAGTVYAARDVLEPMADAEIVLTDASGATWTAASNEVGNFYVARESWSPVYPVLVKLQDERLGRRIVKPMVTPIGREGGCAACHYGADGEPTHVPPVFLRDKPL